MQVHDKGGMFDFKLDGAGCQNHDGIDYSNEKERLRRVSAISKSGSSRSGKELLHYYCRHGHHGTNGITKVVSTRKLRWLLQESDNEYCFVLANSDAETKSDAAWRALAAEQKQAIQSWTKEMLQAGIIRPSSSPYCSPTFCVRKKNGEWRIVHDFRGLNAKVRVPANPIPRKDDILRDLARGKMFSSMDLLWGFSQVKLREDSIPFTAFATPDGLYEYLVTPMGVASSPSSFNRLVQSIFADCRDFCKTSFDDLFVFTPYDDVDEHLRALEKVLQRCADEQLYVKIEICVFCASEIPCLGDFVGRDGLRMDPAKATAIANWPLPKTKRELQSFLGACVYVMRFCSGFAEYIAPLTEMTKNKKARDEVNFTDTQLAAFTALKATLASPPVLAHPDFTKPFHVSVDASDFANDDSERIIAYGGRKLTQAELVYPAREKELLAALHAMRTWKVFLIDKPFFINTAHHTIENILQ
ncbi:unnamed protein product [Phytophthora lilii]|uniref:Unnamed protein product n=1 Tax=Phytophthora lilii TaxID=2077276 RepID=A0A9W6UEF1_9STRA|nr:unnamed protein product [Phytophthora lilii]